MNGEIKTGRKPRPTGTELIFVAQFFTACIILLSLARLVFLVVYHYDYTDVPLGEILLGLLHGLRFDASATAFGVIAVLILAHLPVINRSSLFRWLWIVMAHAVFVMFFLMSFGDLLYFAHARKRLGYEAFAYLDLSMLPIAVAALKESPLFFVAAFLFLVIFLVVAWWNVRKLQLGRNSYRSPRHWVVVILAIGALVLMARGGWQRVPLRPADSFVSRFRSVNLLAVNAPYMAFRTYSYGKNRIRLMDTDKAQSIALGVLGKNIENLPLPEYPLFTRVVSDTPDSIRPYNVILILVESLTAKFTVAGGDTLGVMPEFSRLADEGLLFDRFFATGFRSTSGLFSSLTGIPDQPGAPVMRRPELQDRFSSVSVLLGEQGYKNVFVTGGHLDFDNLDDMLLYEHFDLMMGVDEIEGSGQPRHTWGYDDEQIYRWLHEEILRCGNQPVFGYVMTISSHSPYDVPDEGEPRFSSNDTPEYKYLNALHYADRALGRFISWAARDGYLDNTIFVITGDHTHHKRLNLFENQHVPLLIYAPGIVEPGRRSTIGSHTDIPATIAGLLGLPHHATMGRDLMAVPEDSGFAYWISGMKIGWTEGEHIAIMDLCRKLPLVYDLVGGDFSNDRTYTDTVLARSLWEKAVAFYTLGSDLLVRDRIYPGPRLQDYGDTTGP